MSSFKEMLGREFIKFAEENNLKKVQACVDLEVDIIAENSSGDTAAHVAAKAGNSEVIKLLASTGHVDWNRRNYYGWNIAELAIINRRGSVVKILAEQELCNFWNIPDELGYTPIMYAIRRGDTEILKILLKCPRVDPNIKDGGGDSPVMMAIKMDKIALSRILIKCPRVDLRIKDRNGSSLLKIAR